ncbi:MAG: hypothetical protein ACI8XZ_003755 [Gammaproteobacteria bacterium]|jgi:hypothetical protein
MLSFIALIGAVALAPPIRNGLLAVPQDVQIGRHVVELRRPLIARTHGVKLVLFVRRRGELGIDTANVIQDFQAKVPRGSVDAYLSGSDGEELSLTHSDYVFYRGHMGLVLTEVEPAERGDRYRHLELDAKIPLQNVRFVWLDRAGRRIDDVQPTL